MGLSELKDKVLMYIENADKVNFRRFLEQKRRSIFYY